MLMFLDLIIFINIFSIINTNTNNEYHESVENATYVDMLTKLKTKMNWCVTQLNDSTTPIEIQQWGSTLKILAETAIALQKCLDSK